MEGLQRCFKVGCRGSLESMGAGSRVGAGRTPVFGAQVPGGYPLLEPGLDLGPLGPCHLFAV